MKAVPIYKKFKVINEMVKAEKNFAIRLLCEIAEVSRSGYYKWLNRQISPSGKQREDEDSSSDQEEASLLRKERSLCYVR